MAHGVLNINNQTLFASSQIRPVTQLDFIQFSDLNHTTTFSTNAASAGSEGAGFGVAASSASFGISNSTSTAGFGGMTGPSSAISITTSTTNNATDVGSINTLSTLLPGLPIPAAGFITKYEFETRIRTAATIHSNTVRGAFRAGFMDVNGMNTAGDSSFAGPHFRFMCNGTVTDTNWMIYWVNPNSGLNSTADTGVAVNVSTTYRLYLATEVNSAGVYTTTYKIFNENTGTKTEGTASPSASTHNTGEGWSTYAMGAAVVNCKAVTATTTAIALYIDYMGVRIRRPISREILIGSI
tara:strand:- start:1457 stop:2347 length:891 start_codon:yes stop_codon:yes gene_type:complete